MDKTFDRIRRSVRLDGPEIGGMSTWFPGPVGENEALLERLVTHVVREHCDTRRAAYPMDPPWIDTSKPGHRVQSRHLQTQLEVLLRRLGRYSIPWYSYRYHAHMNWDNSLPAVVGYFAAMLFNQNNVAGEGSPVTTALEIEVAADLCRMLGYDTEGELRPWGHITCGGTVANIEAMWAARNLKLYPFAVQSALRRGEIKYDGFQVTLPDGATKKPLKDLSAWEILNLTADEALGIPRRLKEETGWAKEKLDAINDHSVQHLGLGGFARRFEEEHPGNGAKISSLAFLAPASCHYSMPKAATLMGLGDRGVIRVHIDKTARMDFDHLTELLDERIDRQLPVAGVVAVVGTTQEGAVDPVQRILDLRETYRAEHHFDFTIHVDAAWGGYFLSLLRAAHPDSPSTGFLRAAKHALRALEGDEPREPSGAELAHEQMKMLRDAPFAGSEGNAFTPTSRTETSVDSSEWLNVLKNLDSGNDAIVHTPEMDLSPYTIEQMKALKDVDSITIDPHKAGFAPYPAGALCYRNGAMPEMVAISAPIVYREGDAQTVGIFGIEGSKPGAAAAGVWLSHRIIRPDQGGYGKILGRCIFNAKRLIAAIACMESDEFVVEPLQELSDGERAALREMNRLNNEKLWDELRTNFQWEELFRQFGSDLVVNTYAVNLRLDDGGRNKDPELANTFNERVYRRLSLDHEGDDWPPIIVTGSQYDPAVTRADFVNDYRARLGIDKSDLPMSILVSTTVNPWLTDERPVRRNMIPEIVDAMQDVIEEVAVEVKREMKDELRKGRWG